MNYKVTAEEALKQLLEQNELPFTVMVKHGSMTIEYFAPQEVDTQTPHKQDEIYIVIKGHRRFLSQWRKKFYAGKTMFCLFPLVWTITLKTFLMILLSG